MPSEMEPRGSAGRTSPSAAPRSIGEMTADSCVLLTGITGFVGGCLLERICRLEPGPARIYVLVREKHGVDPQSRVERLLESPLFSGVPEHKLKLVQAVSGDVGSDSPDLGLGEADLRLLLDTCTHIFHSAAFISFAAELDIAIKINLRGSRAVLGLARRMRRLRSMVHVSTAYVNCYAGTENSTFEERLSPVDVDPVDVLEAVSSMSSREIEARFAGPIGKHPNTYTFTKQLAENLLARERSKVALSIVRPGIILNSWREPFPGWVDNVNSAACGFIAGAGKGVFCTFQARSDIIMDAVPVDIVISTILAAALKAEQEPEQLHIFHCTSGTVNPITWGDYCAGIIRASKDHPCENAAWYPRARLRESQFRNNLVILLFQMIPAIFIDLLAKITKPGHEVVKVQWRYIKGSNYTAYFSMREWQFSRKETDKLCQLLPEDERQKHPMDPRLINWDAYLDTCIIGTRRYFHGETMKTSYSAERRMKVLRVIAIIFPWASFAVVSSGLTIILGIPWKLSALAAALFVIGLVWL